MGNGLRLDFFRVTQAVYTLDEASSGGARTSTTGDLRIVSTDIGDV